MTPTDNQARHVKYGRFGRRDAEGVSIAPHGRRRGHWTGYRPLEDVVTQASLAALIDTADKQTEGNE